MRSLYVRPYLTVHDILDHSVLSFLLSRTLPFPILFPCTNFLFTPWRLSDEEPKWRLILEVMGARSNAILVSHEDNMIQACAYQVSTSTTVRPLQTGGIYQPPPSGGGIFSPINKGKVEIKEYFPLFSSRLKELDVTVEKSLVSCYRGMSPNIAHKILDASKIDCNHMVKVLSEEDTFNIFKYFSAWASIFDDSAISHSLVSSTSLSIQPEVIQYSNRKNSEFCPIAFIDHDQDDLKGHQESSEEISIITNEEESDSTIQTNMKNSNDDDGYSSSDSLIVSKFLLTFYSLFERKTAFELLHSVCEKKVNLRLKKADKILKDFQIQEKDAK